jgi:FkbM family methyltransferase
MNVHNHPREANKHLNEAEWINHMMLSKRRHGVMVDVGAHHGYTALPFLRAGWRVIAFEPDPTNRAQLETHLATYPTLTVDPRAVGDTPAQDVPLFASSVSSGISGLLNFHTAHTVQATVDVTTLAHALTEHGVDACHVLKVDVEGYEMPVLRGMDWQAYLPDVAIVEFEDSKTRLLGYTHVELAEFLIAKGYTVYLSEWHPVLEYGTTHQWRGLFRYPNALHHADAWGNLVAFKGDITDKTVYKSLARFLKTKEPAPAWRKLASRLKKAILRR